MKKCEHCNVNVNTNNNLCPLCYGELTHIGGEANEMFQKKQKVEKNNGHTLLIKIFLFLSVIGVSVCLITNLLTQIFPLWSLVVAVSVIYCWVLVLHTILSARSIFEKLLLQIGTIIGLLFICEWISGGAKWMVDYVCPSISMLVIFVLFILALTLKHHKGILAFFIMIFVLTLISVFLLIFNATHYNLLNIITITIGGFAIFGILLFKGKTLKNEFGKKFHV